MRPKPKTPLRKKPFLILVIVGLSMIRYTKSKEIVEHHLGRLPLKRAHRESIVFSTVDGKLVFEIIKREELVSSVEILIVFAVGTFYFTVVPRSKDADSLVPNTMRSESLFK